MAVETIHGVVETVPVTEAETIHGVAAMAQETADHGAVAMALSLAWPDSLQFQTRRH